MINGVKLPTGINRLDEFLGGGIETGTVTVFWTLPGVNDAPFIYQILDQQLKSGSSGIFIVQTKKPGTVECEIKNHGWDVTKYKKKGAFMFIDAYSPLVKQISTEKFIVGNPNNVKEITKALKDSLKEVKDRNTIVVFGSLSTMINNYFKDFLDEIKVWKTLLKKYSAAGIFMFTQWPYGSSVMEKVKRNADTIIQINAIEQQVVLQEFFTLPKVKGRKPVRMHVPFKIDVPGKVAICSPKILLFSNSDQFRFEFLRAVSDDVDIMKHKGVNFEKGYVEHKGFAVDIVSKKNSNLLRAFKLLSDDVIGVIYALNTKQLQHTHEMQGLMDAAYENGIPFVIAPMDFSQDDEKLVSETRKKLKIKRSEAVLPVRLKTKNKIDLVINKKDVDVVLDKIFNTIV